MKSATGLLLAIAMIAAPAEAKSPPRYGPLAYSNACYEEESGDFSGHRLLLWRLDYDLGFFEWSEGPAELARTEELKISEDGHIQFRIDQNQGSGPTTDYLDVSGTITEEGAEIVIRGKPYHLPRVTNYGKTPSCPALEKKG